MIINRKYAAIIFSTLAATAILGTSFNSNSNDDAQRGLQEAPPPPEDLLNALEFFVSQHGDEQIIANPPVSFQNNNKTHNQHG